MVVHVITRFIKHPQYEYDSNIVRDLVLKALEIPGT